MELPDTKGTYVLLAFVAQVKRVEIDRLGSFEIVPGYYAYDSPIAAWTWQNHELDSTEVRWRFVLCLPGCHRY